MRLNDWAEDAATDFLDGNAGDDIETIGVYVRKYYMDRAGIPNPEALPKLLELLERDYKRRDLRHLTAAYAELMKEPTDGN